MDDDTPTLWHPLTKDIEYPHAGMIVHTLRIKGTRCHVVADTPTRGGRAYYWFTMWAGTKYKTTRTKGKPITVADLMDLAKQIQFEIDTNGPREAAALRAWNLGRSR